MSGALILLPVVGFVLAATTGLIIRARQERSEQRARDEFKIS